MTIIALTGHRSEDCEYEPTVRRKLRQVYEDFGSISVVICGMANGVDLWGADEALGKGLEVWAARPWAGHGPRKGDEALYARVLEGASRVVNVDESLEYAGPWVYQKRNEWMVDHADRVLAYWSGKEKGGTWNCIRYAENVGKKVRNCYGDF
jgi:uncharacterized phage-like protein YoqJ